MNNPFLTPDEECFAYDGSINIRGRCRCLTVMQCPGTECSSYKTRKQCEEEAEKTRQRLRKLPYDEQEQIMFKYKVKI